jgi:RNA polymerase sigma-70 factor (ECF subfamily)
MTREHVLMTDPETSQDSRTQDSDQDGDTQDASQPTGTRLDGAALDRLRPLAFSVAYRMLGSVAEAEDVVQEALLRLSQTEGVRNPDAFVTTVTTRIAIDVLRSARVRRESYVGEWLPEPLVGAVQSNLPVAMASAPPDAAAHAELADDLSTAFLVLLERLTPTERAAFLLHDVLGFSHSEAAGVIGTSEVSARQLASRARRRIARERDDAARSTPGRTAPGRAAPGRADRVRAEELVTRFLAACEEGAVDPFLELLTEDVVLTGDGGGKVPPGMSIARPVSGRDAVARVLAAFMRRGAPVHFERALVGGEPGLLIVADDVIGGGLIGTWSFEVVDGQLAGIRGVINPEKLRHLGPQADLERLREWLRNDRPRRSAR